MVVGDGTVTVFDHAQVVAVVEIVADRTTVAEGFQTTTLVVGQLQIVKLLLFSPIGIYLLNGYTLLFKLYQKKNSQ